MVIFDCNGVLVDGEQISAAVAAEEFTRAGIPMSPQLVARFFTGLAPVLHAAVPVLGQVQALLPKLGTALVDMRGLRSAALPAFKAATGAVGASASGSLLGL